MGEEGPPDDVCGYEFDPDRLAGYEAQQSCCVRKTLSDCDQCVWHAETDETDEKTIEALRQARTSPEEREQVSNRTTKFIHPAPSEHKSRTELLDGAVLLSLEDDISFENASLRDADISSLSYSNLSGVNLQNTNLANAVFVGTDLSEANLQNACLSNSLLDGANLSGAELSGADLSEAALPEADLSEANLYNANLSDTNLIGTNLTGADPRADFSGANLKDADFTELGKGFEADLTVTEWNQIARVYNSLASQCSEKGLIREARSLKIGERWARRKEAWAGGDYFEWLGSGIAWQTTGYGISVRRVLRNMVFLFLGATLVYLFLGIGEEETGLTMLEVFNCTSPVHSCPLPQGEFTAAVFDKTYYSIVTFTTAPPEEPHGKIVRSVAMAETFLGTLLVVFLGYVLGNREQV